MSDVFTGMSIKEMDGMPLTWEATLVQLGIEKHDRVPEIAKAQADYTRSVFERCPRWRWHKKRKLAQAVAHGEHVLEMVLDSRARLAALKERTTPTSRAQAPGRRPHQQNLTAGERSSCL